MQHLAASQRREHTLSTHYSTTTCSNRLEEDTTPEWLFFVGALLSHTFAGKTHGTHENGRYSAAAVVRRQYGRMYQADTTAIAAAVSRKRTETT